MRKFIDLLESYVIGPELYSFFMGPYIDYVIKEEEWSSHGSTIDRFAEDHPDDLRTALMDWMPKRLRHIQNDFARHDANTMINRVISLSRDDADKMFAQETITTGVYWGAGDFTPQNRLPITVDFESRLGLVTVDWKETIISRIDYDNGDDEQEYQLVGGTPIIVERFSSYEGNSRLGWREIEHSTDRRFFA